jgi:hypothetical protein
MQERAGVACEQCSGPKKLCTVNLGPHAFEPRVQWATMLGRARQWTQTREQGVSAQQCKGERADGGGSASGIMQQLGRLWPTGWQRMNLHRDRKSDGLKGLQATATGQVRDAHSRVCLCTFTHACARVRFRDPAAWGHRDWTRIAWERTAHGTAASPIWRGSTGLHEQACVRPLLVESCRETPHHWIVIISRNNVLPPSTVGRTTNSCKLLHRPGRGMLQFPPVWRQTQGLQETPALALTPQSPSQTPPQPPS